MTYSDSAKGVWVTEERAMQELRAHGLTIDAELLAEFKASVKPRKDGKYSAIKILYFLGY